MIKLDEEMVGLLNEISAISGIQRAVIREVWEYMFIYWAEKLASNDGKLTELKIPFMGKIAVQYKKDLLNEDGTVSTDIMQFINVSDQFKKLIGDVHDEKFNVVDKILKRKIDSALLALTSNKSTN